MPDALPDFRPLLAALNASGVRFVLIGGLAMSARGSAHVTSDIDVVYARDAVNLQAVVDAFAASRPTLRVGDGEVPFLWDAKTLKAGQNFTLRTTLGDIDLLGEAAGAPPFEELWRRATVMELYGIPVHVASIDDLIAMKRAANRTKDQLHVMELEALKRLIEEQG